MPRSGQQLSLILTAAVVGLFLLGSLVITLTGDLGPTGRQNPARTPTASPSPTVPTLAPSPVGAMGTPAPPPALPTQAVPSPTRPPPPPRPHRHSPADPDPPRLPVNPPGAL